MKYICTDDIEILAAQGKKELSIDEHTVVMDLARDLARQLGIAIVNSSRPALSVPASPVKAAPPPAAAPAARSLASTPGAKPRGCQHAPLPVTSRAEQLQPTRGADGMVDQLVELVRQSANKRSGS